jgi:bla regulator protein BlaR1
MIPENVYAFGMSLGNHLWQSTLFAAAVWMLTMVFQRNQARVRYCLWLAASLKFLLPFSLLVLLVSRLARLHGSAQPTPMFYFVVQRFSQPFSLASNSRIVWSALLQQILGLIWLAGFVTVLGIWWSRWWRAIRAIRDAVPMSDGREVNALRRREQLTQISRPIPLWLSQSSTEPGVFGIMQPILLWPGGISDRLEDAQLEAILAHEIEHVRRRDNLAAVMHMLVEAIFWFHPLVWWLGARLMEEREWACDEEVLRLGSTPETYAQSILKTCEFCVTSPLPCVSGVTGTDLKRRIVRIMTRRTGDKLSGSRKVLLAAITLGTIAVPVIVGLVNTPLIQAESPQDDASAGTLQRPVSQFAGSNFADSQQIYHIGGDVSAPKLIYAPDPVYTEKARQAKYQGVCVISLIVDTKGKPKRIEVVRHLGMGLDKKAVEAVQQYKFTPAMRFGTPVDVTVHIEVNFRIH